MLGHIGLPEKPEARWEWMMARISQRQHRIQQCRIPIYHPGKPSAGARSRRSPAFPGQRDRADANCR